MNSLHLSSLLALFVVVALCAKSRPIKYKRDPRCNCDHCDFNKVIGLDNANASDAVVSSKLYKEDIDDDGDPTICARESHLDDRTFPTVCHMVCFNRCTRYKRVELKEYEITKYVVSGYRPNYYKLKDGAC